MQNFNVKLKDKNGNCIFPYTRADQVEGIESINVSSATKLKSAQSIDGISFDGTSSVLRYTICDTASGTAEKTVSLSNFILAQGAKITVKFTNANSADSPELNVNDTGAFPIVYKGSNVSAGFLEANFPYSFIFSGDNWEITGGAPIDTSVMTITYW